MSAHETYHGDFNTGYNISMATNFTDFLCSQMMVEFIPKTKKKMAARVVHSISRKEIV